jgi:hypothetical protein
VRSFAPGLLQAATRWFGEVDGYGGGGGGGSRSGRWMRRGNRIVLLGV